MRHSIAEDVGLRTQVHTLPKALGLVVERQQLQEEEHKQLVGIQQELVDLVDKPLVQHIEVVPGQVQHIVVLGLDNWLGNTLLDNPHHRHLPAEPLHKG